MPDEDEHVDGTRAPKSGSSGVTPSAALRPGRSDAVIVLLLWAGRRSFAPLLLLGLAVALAVGRLGEGSTAELTSPADLIAALLSPLAGIAAAVLLRIAVGWLALLAALPLSTWNRGDARRSWGQLYRDAVDRWRLAQAYRSLRWTWGVRAEAIERAGQLGRRLGMAVPVTTIATVLAAIAVVVVIVVRATPG